MCILYGKFPQQLLVLISVTINRSSNPWSHHATANKEHYTSNLMKTSDYSHIYSN